jgi:hypothetical protein
MNQTKPSPQPLAVLASEAARLLGISDVHFRKLKRSPLMGPRPVQLGLGPEETGERGERWNVAELTAWLNAGCPPREIWDEMKATRLPQFVTYERSRGEPSGPVQLETAMTGKGMVQS